MYNHNKAVRRSASRADGLETSLFSMRELGIVRNFRFREQEDVMGYLGGLQFQDKELMVRWSQEAARRAADAFPQCTEHQLVAIALYTSNNGTETGNYHTLLNQRLRERRLEPILPLVYLTDTAIHLMGGWQGTVYRGVGFLADLERYQIGAVVCWAQVNSTTTKKDTATTFMYGNPDRTLFVITVIDGADIRRVSLNPSECEVLLPVCSEFEVKSVEHSAPGSPGPAALTIHLEQLPTPPLFTPPLAGPQQRVTGPIAQFLYCLAGPPVVALRKAPAVLGSQAYRNRIIHLDLVENQQADARDTALSDPDPFECAVKMPAPLGSQTWGSPPREFPHRAIGAGQPSFTAEEREEMMDMAKVRLARVRPCLGMQVATCAGTVTVTRSRGPASNTGIRCNDELLRFGSCDIQSIQDFVVAVRELRPGVETYIAVRRSNETLVLPIRVGAQITEKQYVALQRIAEGADLRPDDPELLQEVNLPKDVVYAW